MKYFITVSRVDLDGFGHDCGTVGYDNQSTDCYENYLFFASKAEAEAWTKSDKAKEWGDDAKFDICADDYYTFAENVADELSAFCGDGRAEPDLKWCTDEQKNMFEKCREEFSATEDHAVIKIWAEKIADNVKNN